jgi:phosphomannomutase
MSLLFRGRAAPVQLAFGTSGLRGLVRDITDMEAYINTRGFLRYAAARAGETVFVGGDLRPSTPLIAAAVVRACRDAHCVVVFAGSIPTPALMAYAVPRDALSVMVTGSHIPFDRNGIKFNLRSGEVLKADEPGILAAVAAVRALVYAESADDSLFDDNGAFKPDQRPPLPAVENAVANAYRARYVEFFGGDALTGATVVFFQHSAVGRDLIVELLRAISAPLFIRPSAASRLCRSTLRRSRTSASPIFSAWPTRRVARTVASTPSSPPTATAIARSLSASIAQGRAHFFGGDLLGVVVAEWLGATHVAVPISTNDCCDIQPRRARRPHVAKTMIGSPYVVRADARYRHRSAAAPKSSAGRPTVAFSSARRLSSSGRTLAPLLTRDAVLPIAACLRASIAQKRSVVRALWCAPGTLQQGQSARQFCARLGAGAVGVVRTTRQSRQRHRYCRRRAACAPRSRRRSRAADGFAAPVRVDWTDGVRVWFANGDIAHIRPSGNAPQLRIYAVAEHAAACRRHCASRGARARRYFAKVGITNQYEYEMKARTEIIMGESTHNDARVFGARLRRVHQNGRQCSINFNFILSMCMCIIVTSCHSESSETFQKHFSCHGVSDFLTFRLFFFFFLAKKNPCKK